MLKTHPNANIAGQELAGTAPKMGLPAGQHGDKIDTGLHFKDRRTNGCMRGRGSSHTHLVNGHGGTRDVPPVNEDLRRDVQTQELQPVGLALMEGARRRPPLSERMVEEAEDALGVDGLS